MNLGENGIPSENEEDTANSPFERLKKSNRRKEREIRRLKGTVSFQIGVHITDSFRSLWRIPFLPFSLPFLALRLGLQRLGRKPNASSLEIDLINETDRKHCIVLFPTNGVGFGHFTRMYAVAKALRKADPSLEIVFFTPMPTLHILYREQFPTYHLAGRYKHADMSALEWNGLVEDMLHIIFDMHRPKWFMFDGAFPYRGMLDAIASQPHMKKWWMRRGSLKKNKSVPVDSQLFFDGIVIPSEGGEPNSNEDLKFVSPIKAVEPADAWGRDFARSRLSAPDESKVIYVQLGAGRINDIEDVLGLVLDVLFAHADVIVVLGESMLGDRLPFSHERLRVVRDYPNALYAKGFDASVQAGGYNSFQEMRMFGIPTLFLPNTQTGMDDQVMRCRVAEDEGWGIVNLKPSVKQLTIDVNQLLKINKQPIQNSPNGANEVANLLLSDE